MEQNIACPKCGHEFELSSALIAKLEDRVRKQAAAETRQAARAEFTKEKAELEARVAAQARALAEAQANELALRKEKHALDERAAALDLEIARKLDAERRQVEKAVEARLLEERRLADSQKEEYITRLKAQIDDLKRRAEQGSQQTQGEAAEVQLEEVLRAAFPGDGLQPVGTGQRGADLLQEVRAPLGARCGTIIWESKDTKHWNQDWLRKLKDDQLQAKAHLAVIVSAALPEGIATFGCVNGVWITKFACAVGLATALRENLIAVERARAAAAGKEEKMELLYDYLAGTEFRRRVEAMAEAFTAMHSDLISERRAMERIWAKREKQIERFVKNVTGMYGDVQGIAGAALPDLPRLELPVDGDQRQLADSV